MVVVMMMMMMMMMMLLAVCVIKITSWQLISMKLATIASVAVCCQARKLGSRCYG
jgi:hypothetical protein